jgi:hypothetical protein
MRIRVDDLIGNGGSHEIQTVREGHHNRDENEKDHQRMRNVVSHPLDRIQNLPHRRLDAFVSALVSADSR